MRHASCAMRLRKTHSAQRTAQAAFTFIELLLVIAIIGILTAVSLPSLKKTFNNLELNNFSGELQALANYLRERSIVEGAVIYLKIDNENREVWAQIKEASGRLKTLQFPEGIRIESENNQVTFFPDGEIDKVRISVVSLDGQKITLTTIGVYGGFKILPQ